MHKYQYNTPDDNATGIECAAKLVQRQKRPKSVVSGNEKVINAAKNFSLDQ